MAQISRSPCRCVFVKRFPDVCAAAGAALGQKGLREHSVGSMSLQGRQQKGAVWRGVRHHFSTSCFILSLRNWNSSPWGPEAFLAEAACINPIYSYCLCRCGFH